MDKKIKVIGLGGSGCSIIRSLEKNYKFKDNVKLIGSDSATCGMRDCKNKLPLERVYPIYCKVKGILERNDTSMGDIMCCIGCSSNPILGELSASYKYNEIVKELEGVDKLILTTVLGGGTGSGAIKAFIKIAQELNIDTSCIISISILKKHLAEDTMKEILNMGVEIIECNIFDYSKTNLTNFFKNIDLKIAQKISDIFLNDYALDIGDDHK